MAKKNQSSHFQSILADSSIGKLLDQLEKDKDRMLPPPVIEGDREEPDTLPVASLPVELLPVEPAPVESGPEPVAVESMPESPPVESAPNGLAPPELLVEPAGKPGLRPVAPKKKTHLSELVSVLKNLPVAERTNGFNKNRIHAELSEENSFYLKQLQEASCQVDIAEFQPRQLINFLVTDFIQQHKSAIQTLILSHQKKQQDEITRRLQ